MNKIAKDKVVGEEIAGMLSRGIDPVTGKRELGGKAKSKKHNMRCPNCTEELKYVEVYSTCSQRGYLHGGTNQIKRYGKPKNDCSIEDMECPFCHECIIDFIET